MKAPLTINVANIRALADFIELEAYSFDMEVDVVKPACGSAGCIGGHAAVLWPDIRDDRGDGFFSFNEDRLADKLGITYAAQENLCFMLDTCRGLSSVTRQQAVAVLRLLAATAEVQWDAVQ